MDIPNSVIDQMVIDYEALNGPFASTELPINRALNELELTADRDRALYITLDGALNSQRDADVLRDQTIELWKDEPWVFQPNQVVERGFEELKEEFSGRGFRRTQTDPEFWYRNAYTLHREYGGDPMNLFSQFEFDANAMFRHAGTAVYEEEVHPQFQNLKNNKKFAGLGGPKVGALWLQNIHMLVTDLYNLQEVASNLDDAPPAIEDGRVPIPVDTHVATVTGELLNRDFDPNHDRQEIENIWDEFFDHSELDPLRVDKPIWTLGRIWDAEGRDYLQRLKDQTTA